MTTPELTTEIIPVQGRLITVNFKRSARAKRISLKVDLSLGVCITLPLKASRKAGLALLHAHGDWVHNKLSALPQKLSLKAGALVPVSGVAHEIIHTPEGRGGAWIEEQHIYVTGAPEFLPRRVIDCLKRHAQQKLSNAAIHTALRAQLRPKIVRIKDTRTRWGSCTSDGTLAFSWRLICAPAFVQDYVVAHEVAHLRHMNHSPQFWTLTEQLTPHRREATSWLASEGQSLLQIG